MKTLDEIAAALQGYDPQALHADTVAHFLSAYVGSVTEVQTIPLMESLGRVLAEDLISPIHVPAHDNSAMDGYAFAASALPSGQAWMLKVVGTALAGAAWQGQVGPGECLRIMTGAVMPAGLDTVAPQEMVQQSGDHITISAGAVQPGDNRRFKGEDLEQGKPALHRGSRITPAALGLIASLGIGEVTVRRRLRVAFFSTGDEILSIGEAPRDGAVYDSNRYTLFGLLSRLGVDLLDMGVVRDDPLALEAAFRKASEQADAIITSGGVSVGEADHTKAVMQKMAGGASGVAFWKIAMRPGRPMAVGRIGQSVLFGLPGNPVAVMVTFLAFVRPALLQMMGASDQTQPLLRAKSMESIRKKPGRTEYQRGLVSIGSDGGLQVRTTGQQGSGVLSSMVQGNGLIVLRHQQGNVAIGDDVEVMMFEGAI